MSVSCVVGVFSYQQQYRTPKYDLLLHEEPKPVSSSSKFINCLVTTTENYTRSEKRKK